MGETVEYLDTVRNKNSGVVGVVDAIYMNGNVQQIDLRVDNNMYYGLIAANFEVVEKNDE